MENLIDDLGGPTKVAAMAGVSVPTVCGWKKIPERDDRAGEWRLRDRRADADRRWVGAHKRSIMATPSRPAMH